MSTPWRKLSYEQLAELEFFGKDVVGISPNDEFDIRPWYLWNYEKYQESFTVIK